MSLLDQASLVLVPSAIKTGEVLVQKPLPTKFSDETGNYDGNDPQGSANLTFTRASNASRIGPDGLIHKVRTNLLLQSNTFSNAIWNLVVSTATSGQTDKDGGTNAWLISWSATQSTSYIYENITISTPHTASCWVKGTAGQKIKFGYGVNVAQGANITFSGEWQRISHTSSSGNFLFFSNFISDNASSFYVQYCQSEAGDIATDYIPTTTAAVSVGPVSGLPRLDYSGGATCPSLKLEPQRSNLCLWSENFDNAAWGKTNVSVTANSVTSPDGYLNADSLQISASTEPRIRQTTTQTGSTAFTFSCFAKKGNVDFLILRNIAINNVGGSRAWFNLNTGVVGTVNAGLTASMVSYANGWYRCVISGTTDASPTNLVDISLSLANGSISGSAIGSNIYIYGAQLEQGAYESSYLNTLSTSVTRLADATQSGTLSAVSGGEVSFFLDIDGAPNPSSNSTSANFQWYFTSGNWVAWNNNTTSSHRIRVTSALGNEYFAADVRRDDRCKIVALLTETEAKVYANGVLVGTQTIDADWSTTNGIFTSITNAVGVVPIKQMILFPIRLTDAQAIELTTI